MESSLKILFVAFFLFKGYRDADCGWVDIESEWGGSKRRVSFLLIYAPRRGLLEVWTPQQGPRVAAFNVPKYAKYDYGLYLIIFSFRFYLVNKIILLLFEILPCKQICNYVNGNR